MAGRVPRLDGAELGGVRAVYLWADAVYMNDGLESDKAAILVVVLYLSDGSNVIAYLGSDYRESEERWAGPPRDLKQRGLEDSRSAVGDGVPGLRSVLTGIFSKMREQSCWNQKLVNVLDHVSRNKQREARAIAAAS